MRKTVETYVEVDVDLVDFDTEDLIEEIERRGLTVIDEDDSGAMSAAVVDDIYDLYRDYINSSDFDSKLKAFFRGHLGILIR